MVWWWCDDDDDDDVMKLKLEVSRDYNSASGGASYLLGGIKRCIADPLNHITAALGHTEQIHVWNKT